MTQGLAAIRRSLIAGGVAFGLVLAAVIGLRLEQAALTALVGAACGVVASVPTSLLVVVLLRKRGDQQAKGTPPSMARRPPVVVITPGAGQSARRAGAWPGEYALPLPSQRRFCVVGDGEVRDL